MSVVVVIPSRGRPDRAREAIDCIRDTAILVSTSIALVVDEDDPEVEGYRRLSSRVRYGPEASLIVLPPEDTGNLVRATNTVALRVARNDPTCIIGNLGDDHLARTNGWDAAIAGALTEPGIAYGDDLIQGQHLPTAPFISAQIVLALGWYALPVCQHMYIDDAWREIGQRLNRLHYLPSVVIEHMHPAVGKGTLDDGYLRADASMSTDQVAYARWMASRAAEDIRRVRHVLWSQTPRDRRH